MHLPSFFKKKKKAETAITETIDDTPKAEPEPLLEVPEAKALSVEEAVPNINANTDKTGKHKFRHFIYKIKSLFVKTKDNRFEPKVLPDDTERFDPEIDKGLEDQQVKKRQEEGLTNKNKVKMGKTYNQIVFGNVFTFFNMILLGLAIALMIFGNYNQTYFLWVAIANTGIAIFQEIRSKKTIEKLRLVTAQNVQVVRDGKKSSIPTDQLVLDDIYHLANGDQIPTDSIILDGIVEINESLLTGESLPIKKNKGDKILAGSFLVSGECVVKAVEIGDFNYVSGIQAKAKEYSKPKSELLVSLNTIIKVISIIIIPLGILLFYTQWINNSGLDSIWDIANKATTQTAGSLVGMIPSGMYLLTSVALAVGVINLAKRKTLVQDLYCIEMLARVNYLCLDKTGTLTDGTMKVDEVLMIDKTFDMDKLLGSYLGAFNESNQTTIALSQRFPLRNDFPIIGKIPFSSSRKYSAVNFNEMGTFILGAPEYVYKSKDRLVTKYINEKQRAGYRVVMLCHTDGKIKNGEIEGKSLPVAIFVLEDHVRNEAPATIKWFCDNNVNIKIISGDNPLTASEIAKKCGVPDAEKCISLEGVSINQISELVDKYAVFGRVSPEQKAAIIKELKNRHNTVGMTGDGVNDILAMKQADCSIAMANGASAARNVAHLVLLDSNFASMPAVVQEGRRVVNNIQRSSALFLMKTIFTISFTVIVLLTFLNGGNGIEYPFSPNNIMIMECVGIGFPSFFLALQKNDQLIRGHFLKNTFSRAIPGAICLILAIGLNYILQANGNFLDLPADPALSKLSFTTFCSLTMAIIAMGMVYNCCFPFNLYRTILFLSMMALFALMCFAMPNIPAMASYPPNWESLSQYWNLSTQFSGIDYRTLTKTMWLLLVIYGTVVTAMLELLISLFSKMREGPAFGTFFTKNKKNKDTFKADEKQAVTVSIDNEKDNQTVINQ